MTRTDFGPKNTGNSTHNNALSTTQQSDDTNKKLNKQVIHTVYHPPFDLTVVCLHIPQQDHDKSIDVDTESDSSNDCDGIDMESDTYNDGNEEHESGDEDGIANELQNRCVEGELSETSNTYSNHGMNDYNMIGRQEKMNEVFNIEKKYQQVSWQKWNF